MKRRFIKILLPKPRSAKKGEINDSFVDRFTAVHFIIGFGYGALGLGFFPFLLLALLWEFLENPLKFYFPFIFPHDTADTFKNSVGDFLAAFLGWMVGRYLI